jgi:hypothetical protein
MVAVKNLSITFHKCLALVVIAALLALPLVSITGDFALIPEKSALTDLAYTAHDGDFGWFSLIKTEPEHSLGGGLSLSEEMQLVGDNQQSSKYPPRILLPPQEISSEVPIPPNIIS